MVAYALQESRVSVGTDLSTEIYNAASNGGGNLVSYKPGTANPGKVPTDMVEYTLKMKKGYLLQVNSISFDAVKRGTDNAYFGWSVTADGVESAYKAYSNPKEQILRDNNANNDKAKLNHEESVSVNACRTFTVRFYISNVASDKKMAIGNLKIDALVSGTEEVRAFQNFAIDFRTNPYTVVEPEGGLPEGVEVTANNYHGDQHGTIDGTIKVPVDGPVCFYLGGCQFTNAATVKDSKGTVLGTIDTNTPGCDNCYPEPIMHTAKWVYNNETPDVLTFQLGSYCPYFKAEACEYIPLCIVRYYDTDGKTVIKEEEVMGGSSLTYSVSADQVTVADGYKFRGWYNSTQLTAVKVPENTPISEDINLYAVATPIEIPTNTSRYVYELNKTNFYIDDHEAIWQNGGTYHDGQHGWVFSQGNTLSVAVAGNCYVSMGNCQFSDSTRVVVRNAAGTEVTSFINKVKPDGAVVTFQYASDKPDTLTFTFGGTTYVHNVTIYNVVEFVAYDENTGYYIIPANDANSFLLALNAANGKGNCKIFLPNGTYDLGNLCLTTISGRNISIIGESMEKTIIVNKPDKEGIGITATLLNTSNNLYLQDLTLKNAYPYYKVGGDGRAVCLQDKGSNTICKRVRLLSYQDTYYSNAASNFYWEDSEIHGLVDYLCGDGNVIYNRTKLVNESRSASGNTGDVTLCAPYNTASTSSRYNWGYVFLDCTIETLSATFNLGRAWGGESKAAYLRTTINQPSKLAGSRWTAGGMNVAAAAFKEYKTMNPQGTVISPASKVMTFTHSSGNKTYETILTDEEAAQYTVDNIFGTWHPDQTCAQLPATEELTKAVLREPSIEYHDPITELEWKAVEGATAYLITLSTDESYILPADQTLFEITGEIQGAEVRAANARGGFGAPAVVGDMSALRTIQEVAPATSTRTFDLQGRPTSRRGLVIEDGKVILVK